MRKTHQSLNRKPWGERTPEPQGNPRGSECLAPGLPRMVMVIALGAVLMASATAGAAPGDLARGFPQLDRNFKIIDRPAQDYNCIAYTLGLFNQWIDPQTGPANAPFAPMDQLYARYGYQRTPALDLAPNPQLQRIAIYALTTPNGAIKQITHAALQGSDGSWTSKLGHLPLIRHASPYAVDGPIYGVPVATYVRARPNNGAVANAGNFGAISNMQNGRPFNQNLPTNNFKSGSIRNGFNNFAQPTMSNNAGRTFGVNNSPPNNLFAGGFESNSFARSSVGNGAAFAQSGIQIKGNVRINGGIHVRGGLGNGISIESFANSDVRINGGIHIRGPVANAFRDAGRCCCNDGTFANGPFINGPANNFSGPNNANNFTNFGNAKNAGNSLNALVNNQGAFKNFLNANNVGTTKNAGNGFNSFSANQGQCKTSKNGANYAGNAKNAGNSLNALVNNGGKGFNSPVNNAFATNAGNRVGSLPGGIHVNIKGDGNKVFINTGAAKFANNGSPANAIAKNGPANNALAKNAANAKNLNFAQPLAANLANNKNAGNAKNAGVNNNLAKNIGNVKNAGNSLVGNTLKNNIAANNNRAGNRPIGSLPGGIHVNINGNNNNVRINTGSVMPANNIAKKTTAPGNVLAKNMTMPSNNLAKNNVGNLVGNKNQSPLNAKNGAGNKMPVMQAPLNAKNAVGNLVGNKVASNHTPLNIKKPVGNQAPISVKPAANNLLAKNAINQQRPANVANAMSAQLKSGVNNAAKMNQPKTSPVNNLSFKPAPQQRQMMPNMARNIQSNPIQAMTANARGSMSNTMMQSRPMQMPQANIRRR